MLSTLEKQTLFYSGPCIDLSLWYLITLGDLLKFTQKDSSRTKNPGSPSSTLTTPQDPSSTPASLVGLHRQSRTGAIDISQLVQCPHVESPPNWGTVTEDLRHPGLYDSYNSLLLCKLFITARMMFPAPLGTDS